MKIKGSFLLLICVGGCLSTLPVVPPRYQIGVPEARADISTNGIVLIGSSAAEKRAVDGNTYAIRWHVTSNDTYGVEAWPKYRQHIRLSIDGGTTWPYLIGYGVPTPRGWTEAEWEWSPPDNFEYLTENARLQIFDLDNRRIINGPSTGFPGDTETGIISPEFAICGATIDEPSEGDVLYNNTPCTIQWRQVGGGTNANLYAVTPTNHWLVTTFSNVVSGANVRQIYLPIDFPVASEMRFAIRGVQYPVIVGYSGTFEVRP